MGILNDREIEDSAVLNPLIPYKVREYQGVKRVSYGLSSFGYDISLSEEELKLFYPSVRINDPKNFNSDVLNDARFVREGNQSYFILPAHSYALGVSREEFDIPLDVLGLCYAKSTYARLGIICNLTPLEPGWKGFLTIELFNAATNPCRIYCNEGIAQVVFLKGEEPEATYSGKYQNQPSNVVFSQV